MGPYEIKGPISDDSLNKTNQMFRELYTMRNVLQTQNLLYNLQHYL